MKSIKSLWRLTVTTTPEAEDAVADLLGALFSHSAASHFNVETRICAVNVFGPRNLILKRGCKEAIHAGLNRIRHCGLNLGPGRVTITKVRPEDWAESWKRHFRPIEIGRTLLIKPSWIKRKPRANQTVVILDPGLSFGTGQHATTSFCLSEIVKHRPGPVAGSSSVSRPQKTASDKSFLDMGTGSGILAIAAAKLDYGPVHAFDFDPEAVRVACTNARVNHVGQKVKIKRADVTKLPRRPARCFHLICANLVSNLLIAERRRIVAQLHREGTLVLAGILKQEFYQVQPAFEDFGLKLTAAKSEKEWRSGSFCFANP